MLTLVITGVLFGSSAHARAIQPAPEYTDADLLEERFAVNVQPILDAYCFDCHNQRRHKGNVRLDTLSSIKDFISVSDTLAIARERVSSGEMPPPDEPAPGAADRATVLSWLDDMLSYYPADGQVDPGWFTIHRLNNTEYQNTLCDLLFIDRDSLDLAAQLPADDTGYGFDNIADVLTISPTHLDQYLSTASRAVDYALGPLVEPGTEPKATSRLTLAGNGGPLPRGGYMLYSHGSVGTLFDAPIGGQYELVVEAWGTPGGDEDPRLSIRIGGREVKWFWVKAGKGESQDCKITVQLESGKHEIGAFFTNDFYIRGVADRNLAIESITVTGPLEIDPQARPPSYRRILGPEDERNQPGAARRVIGRFATRAYRRPLTRPEMERLMTLYRKTLASGASREASIRRVLKACLVTPQFLYRSVDSRDTDTSQVYQLNAWELASRLSYFLWSSMPDEELFARAADGTLMEDDTLRTQVRRMVQDPRSKALVENFVGQWLQLRNLDEIAFDQQKYPQYNESLRASMIKEARLFFADVVRNNRSVLDLVDAPDTFINQQLADVYNLEEPETSEFVRVELPEGSPRGGVLTMAGVLAVTSYPTRTSPVRRGHFVLEELLGMPPPPPPPDTPPLVQAAQNLAPDASFREQLAAHLADATCASCHRRMDPIGLALENFDPVGAWRETENGAEIDPSGVLPGGVEFVGVQGLKKILLERHAQIVENMTRKMLTYALGRGMEPFDRPAVMRIVRRTGQDDNRMQTLIEQIVLSAPFRSCRSRGVGNE